MSDTVIRVENLSKRYAIGAKKSEPKTRSEAIAGMVSAPFRSLRSLVREPQEDEILWALKDVSFEVKAGEVVGVIGRNGAGKSTLLKILSRITKPSSGYAEIRGRVGSLLEVGTGFHPELTGRENIYLNGAILGMRRWEIDRKFDEIVDFAEVERFLDTPVKRYSSGMYVRLAFAVAAHLETEILIVDEVLAVGDTHFQKKCLGKMENLADKEGRTVLFVSHNSSAISALCSLGLYLEQGQSKYYGDIGNCLSNYFKDRQEVIIMNNWRGDVGNEKIRMTEFSVIQYDSLEAYLVTHKITKIQLRYKIIQRLRDLIIGLRISSIQGRDLAYLRVDDYIENEEVYSSVDEHFLELKIPAHQFSQGIFVINVDIAIHNVIRIIDESLVVRFVNTEGIGKKYLVSGNKFDNMFRPRWVWEIN